MQLPQDIEERLQRRWSARHNQYLELRIRSQKRILNETEVTLEKVESSEDDNTTINH